MTDEAKELIKQIVDFENSPDYRKLNSYYSKPSMFSILDIARNETRHSNFIAWLLTPKPQKNNHGLDDFALRKLLGLLGHVSSTIEHSRAKDKIEYELATKLITGRYKLEDVSVIRERNVSIEKTEKIKKTKGYIDIYISAKISYGDTDDKKEIPLTIIIENKVKSSEQKNQTKDYWNALKREEEVRINKSIKKEILLGIYLTPLGNDEYKDLDNNKLDKKRCSSEDFIQLNYQYLTDYVIVPCREEVNIDIIKQYIDEYMLALSSPELRAEENVIMAYTQYERTLLLKFWEEHKSLIFAALNNIVSTLDSEKSEYIEDELLSNFWNKNENLLMVALEAITSSNRDTLTAEDFKKIGDNTKQLKGFKDTTLYKFTYNNEEIDTNLNMGDLVVAIIKHYVYVQKHNNITLQQLQSDFPREQIKVFGEHVIVPEIYATTLQLYENTDKKKPCRYYTGKDKFIHISENERCAISNHWYTTATKKGTIEQFIKYVNDNNKKLGYKIETIES